MTDLNPIIDGVVRMVAETLAHAGAGRPDFFTLMATPEVIDTVYAALASGIRETGLVPEDQVHGAASEAVARLGEYLGQAYTRQMFERIPTEGGAQ